MLSHQHTSFQNSDLFKLLRIGIIAILSQKTKILSSRNSSIRSGVFSSHSVPLYTTPITPFHPYTADRIVVSVFLSPHEVLPLKAGILYI